MNRKELIHQINHKSSFLCVGLDTDIQKIPSFLLDYEDPIFEFNKRIIDATHNFCVAYKPNIAFYESLGPKGWESLAKTLNYIPKDCFTIADAKRGDIGNTSKMYARTFFEYFDFDAVTVSPYMGEDSVTPFLEFEDKWVILLALTSNVGSSNFQRLKITNTNFLYQEVLQISQSWGTVDNLMYVIGATHEAAFKEVRSIVPDHFLLVPGIGSQGGDLEGIMNNGKNKDVGLLVNASRSILYKDNTPNFGIAAAQEAQEIQKNMLRLFV